MFNITRHRSVINPNDNPYPIHIIGCGATGSWVGTILAKMGFTNIHLYDFDIVEEHNLANQNYNKSDIGKSKVVCLKNYMESINDEIKVFEHKERVAGETKLDGIVFLLTDTMKSRKEIYEGCIKNKPAVKMLLETRMGATQGIVYSVRPGCSYEQKAYEQTLYSDDVAETSVCGSSISVIATAMSIAAQVVWQAINFINSEETFYQEIQVEYKNVEHFRQKFLP